MRNLDGRESLTFNGVPGNLSSRASRWQWPNPGGPTYVYIFETTAEGEVQVKIPIINSENPEWTKRLTFAVTIHVGSTAGKPPALHASMAPDQANTAPWKSGWTNLLNDVRQTFTPSLPRLTGVEVGLNEAQVCAC